MFSRLVLLGAVLAIVVDALGATAVSQTPVEPPPDVLVLAEQMPACKEFHNACQVCAKQPDGKLGCSNIGVACNPSGPWRCSAPPQPQPTK